jgi:hypothetical protein
VDSRDDNLSKRCMRCGKEFIGIQGYFHGSCEEDYCILKAGAIEQEIRRKRERLAKRASSRNRRIKQSDVD